MTGMCYIPHAIFTSPAFDETKCLLCRGFMILKASFALIQIQTLPHINKHSRKEWFVFLETSIVTLYSGEN